MAGPPQNLAVVKPCEICGDVGYAGALRVCCRCKKTREHAYCMTICDYDANPETWICEACELGDQIPSSNPTVTFASPSPDASKQPNNSTARSNIRKPPRNTKVQYISPEEAMGLESGTQKKISSSPSKSSLSCRPTINRAPPPTFTVKPIPSDVPPGFANLSSPRSLPSTSHPAKPSGYKDTQKHVVQKQYDRQSSALGVNLSSKTAQTSNATTEERNTQKHVVQKQYDRQSSALGVNLSSKTAQTSNATTEERNTQKHVVQKQYDRQGSALGINLSSKTAQASNAMTEERNKLPPKLYGETSTKTVHHEKLSKSIVGVAQNSGKASSQSVQHSLASSSDKGPVRQLGRETPAAKQPASGKRPRTNSGRENTSPGHIFPHSVQDSTPVSSDKGLAPQLLGDTSALVLRDDAQGERIGSLDEESMGVSLELDKYLLNHPSEFPTWIGRFKIEDDDVVLQCRSLDKIQAHPPCKVSRKAYELSKKLPKALQFELRPRLNIWASLFKDDVPGAMDIALYFLSPNSSSLLSFLDKHEMLLRSQVDGAELLVFSSRCLPRDSQRINKELFFWGLFRETEDKTVPVEGDASEDMEIDMSGGKEVGIIDKVVPKPTKAASPHPTIPDLTHVLPSATSSLMPGEFNMSGGKEVGIIDKVVPKPSKAASPHPTIPGPTPVLPSATSSLMPDEFELGLERCFNKFAMLQKPDNFQVKKEVESPGDR